MRKNGTLQIEGHYEVIFKPSSYFYDQITRIENKQSFMKENKKPD